MRRFVFEREVFEDVSRVSDRGAVGKSQNERLMDGLAAKITRRKSGCELHAVQRYAGKVHDRRAALATAA